MNITLTAARIVSLLIAFVAGTACLCRADVSAATPMAAEGVAAAITSRALGHKMVGGHYAEGVYRGRQVAGFDGASGDIAIDKETGIVVDYMAHDVNVSQETGPPKLSDTEVLKVGLAFLRRSGVEPDGVWTQTDNDYHEVGPGFRQYNLAWHRIFDGVELPSFIIMSINADDGQVMSYHLVDDPVTIPLQVGVTGQQALSRVSEKKGWAYPFVRRSNLAIWYPNGYPGPQALMWRFEIANPDAKTGSDSYVWADVNATTGQIVRLDGPAGFFGPMPKGQKAASVALPKPDLKALRTAKVPPTVFQLAERKKAK